VSTVALLLATTALVLLLWSYAAYPALIARRARLASLRESPLPAGIPSVEVLIAAFDEESVIGPRVENALAESDTVRVAVGCDGCRDRTAERARAAGNGRLRVQESAVRRGKAAVLNDLVSSSRADVLVFTDANSEFVPGAVASLVARFSDPEVGAVCGRLELRPGSGESRTPETEFWDRETRVKEAEGRLGVCLGGNGAIYAARRELVAPLPPETVLDDFLIPARIAADGASVVFDPDAVARERTASNVAAEARRRVRIGIGAGGLLRRERWLYTSKRPLLAFAFLSRKAARWLAPVFGLASIVAGLAAPPLRPAAALMAIAVLALLASIPLSPRPSGWAGRLYYFVVMNLALAAGVVAGLAGVRRAIWDRTAR
jgi:cellulose synthase/poly-beta-1,6-N-acetylglucosamine synthase-like glycosyltransferase